MRVGAWLGLASVPLALAAGVPQEQPPKPSFKTGIGLVQIDVSVLDGKRQPIRGLQASDFTVLEDGKPRPIRVFNAVDLPPRPSPADAGLASDAGSSVATNQVGDEDGRLVFILMDRTIPAGQPALAAKKVAVAAIDALGPTDLAAVVTTGGNVPQTLTSDRARLLRAVNQGDWSQIPSPEQQEIIGKYDPFKDGRCLCGLCVLETVTNIADAVRDAPLRAKSLLFIGSSIIVQSEARPGVVDVLGCDKRLEDARKIMVDALARAHLTVHSIEPTGLVTSMCQGSCNGKQGQNGPAMRLQRQQDETVQRLKDQGSLDILPELTGGRSVVSSNAPEAKVPEIFHESDTYYVLAFEPADPGATAARRPIEVKVARSGARVNTTRYAPPPAGTVTASQRMSAPIDFALAGLLPEARLPLAMSLATFAAATPEKSYVGVTIDASSFIQPGAEPVPLQIKLVASGQRGQRVASARLEATVVAPPGSGGGATNGTPVAEIQTYLALPPGDYELRAAVVDTRTQTAASVFTQVIVPSFSGASLALSDVLLGVRESDGALPDAAPALPLAPTTARAFTAADRARAFARVYRGEAKTGGVASVNVDTSILDATGKSVNHHAQTLADSAFTGRGADVRVDLPLDLDPGGYVLKIVATQGSSTASRTIAFTVKP